MICIYYRMPYGYQNCQPNPYNMGQYGNFNNYSMPPYNNQTMHYLNNTQGGFYCKPSQPQENEQPPLRNIQVNFLSVYLPISPDLHV